MKFQQFRIDDLIKMDQALHDMHIGTRLANAMAEQAILLSKREANVNKIPNKWTHALIERFPANKQCPSRKETWIMFTPSDIEKAKQFHSYPYWKKALSEGHTILCSANMMSWNILLDSDKIIRTVQSSESYLSEYTMKQMVKDTSTKFGL